MRAVPEWIGKTDDEAIPARVKVRLFEAAGKSCQSCTRKLVGRDTPEYDHKRALANGGANRESNLQVLCAWCHEGKTRSDVAEKSVTYRKRRKHYGIEQKSGRPMPGSKRSGIRKRMDGTVERRALPHT